MTLEDNLVRNKNRIIEIIKKDELNDEDKRGRIKKILGLPRLQHYGLYLEATDLQGQYFIAYNEAGQERLTQRYINVIKQGFEWLLPFKIDSQSFFIYIPGNYRPIDTWLNNDSIKGEVAEKVLYEFLGLPYYNHNLDGITINTKIVKNFKQATVPSEITTSIKEGLEKVLEEILMIFPSKLQIRPVSKDFASDLFRSYEDYRQLLDDLTEDEDLRDFQIPVLECANLKLTLQDIRMDIQESKGVYDIKLAMLNFPDYAPWIKMPPEIVMGHLHAYLSAKKQFSKSSPAREGFKRRSDLADAINEQYSKQDDLGISENLSERDFKLAQTRINMRHSFYNMGKDLYSPEKSNLIEERKDYDLPKFMRGILKRRENTSNLIRELFKKIIRPGRILA